jgi:hypothetical protein
VFEQAKTVHAIDRSATVIGARFVLLKILAETVLGQTSHHVWLFYDGEDLDSTLLRF